MSENNNKESEMLGRTFGRLVVLEEAKPVKSRRRWLCRCSCGRETIVWESHLKNGHTKSCGCFRKEKPKEKCLNLQGERYGRLTVLEPMIEKNGTVNYWKCQCDCGKQCFCHKESLRSGTTRSCGCLQEEQRKENMRNAIHFVDGTCVERIACRRTFSNNTSGHRGVYRRENNRWRASIGFQGKKYYLGTFEKYEDAVNARLEAEKELYDSFLSNYQEQNKNV